MIKNPSRWVDFFAECVPSKISDSQRWPFCWTPSVREGGELEAAGLGVGAGGAIAVGSVPANTQSVTWEKQGGGREEGGEKI